MPKVEDRTMFNPCRCRACHKVYEEHKSRADFQGYCSAKCLHTKAAQLGWRPSRAKRERNKYGSPLTEYDVLSEAGETGSVRLSTGPVYGGTT